MTTGLQVVSETLAWEAGPSGTTSYDLFVNEVKKATTKTALSAKFAVSDGDKVKVIANPSGKQLEIQLTWAPTDTPAPAPTFDKTFDASKDTDFNAFFNSLVPGMRVGLKGNCTLAGGLDHGGALGSLISFDSIDHVYPALVSGYLDTRGSFAYTTWNYVKFAGQSAFGGHNNLFTHCEFTANKKYDIVLNMIWDSYYGMSHDNKWTACYFHDAGDISHWADPDYYTNTLNYNHVQIIYDLGQRNTVEDSVIVRGIARGIQDRGGNSPTYQYNIIADCGCAYLVGELGAVDGKFTKNIIAYGAGVPGRNSIENYNAKGTDLRNVADDNIVWGGGVDPSQPGVMTISNVRIIDPMFKDRASGIYVPTNPAVAGYGPRVWPAFAPA